MHESETYRYDAVDMVRQYLADLGRLAYSSLVNAYKAKDLKMFKKESALFLQVLQDQDRLLSSHESFHVSQWLEQARSISTDIDIQDLCEYNARLQIGTWSDKNTSLRDYGHKEWGGMLKDYYYPRWKNYLDFLKNRLEGGVSSQEPDSYLMEKNGLILVINIC